jgi:hypothetical protein
VGHLGFTRLLAVDVDPARETWIDDALSNRRGTRPVPKDDVRFKRFRPALHDAIADAAGIVSAPLHYSLVDLECRIIECFVKAGDVDGRFLRMTS